MVVIPNKEFESDLVKAESFGEGEGFSHETAQALTERVVPAFDMIGLTALFTHGGMSILGEQLWVGGPEIAEGPTLLVGWWDPPPEAKTAFFAPTPHDPGHPLSSPAAESDPDPLLVGFTKHEGTQLIQFHHVIAPGFQQALAEWREIAGFFLTIWRAYAGPPQTRAEPLSCWLVPRRRA